MDPDKVLTELRTLALLVTDGLGPENTIDAAEKMSVCFEALDDWLNKGGFLPTDWNALHRCGAPLASDIQAGLEERLKAAVYAGDITYRRAAKIRGPIDPQEAQ